MPDLRLGKLSPRCPVGLKDFSAYLPQLPTPPAAVQYGAGLSFPMGGNNRYGSCVCAGAEHALQVWASEVGSVWTPPSDEAVIAVYLHLTGGQDTGLGEASTLEIWRTQGLFGQRIDAYAPIHPQHVNAMKVCIDAYGACFVGVQLPQSAQRQFANERPWTVVDGSPNAGGHCILPIGYDAEWVYAVTWAKIQRLSWDWWLRYGDEAWAIIPQAFVAKGRGPTLDLARLQADLAAVAAA